MQIYNNSLCIVASTLPVGFIAAQVDELKIKKVYVLSKTHELSYLHLKDSKPGLNIVRLPSGLFSQSLYLLFVLFWARLSRTNIIFFHECCLPILDLLLCTIRPIGYYFPQVTMSGYKEIELKAFPANKINRLLRLLGVADRFRFYRAPEINDCDSEYAVSLRQYPDSITCMTVGYSRDVMSRCYSVSSSKTNKILFVTGKSFVSDVRQAEVFKVLAMTAHAKGCVCHIKDHPNPVYRLNLQIEGAIVIDPLLPAELMDKDYRLAVGVSSSALLGFNERAISLINLLKEMPQESRMLCAKFFEDALPGNRINYIRSIEEFGALL